MGVGNAMVERVLRSGAHGMLSSSTDLVRYRGRRSGRTITTPTQYAESGDDLVILVARPETKTWWRNFTEPGDADVLVRGEWRAMRATAVRGSEDPDTVSELLAVYLDRFPKAARALPGETAAERNRQAVIVRCSPR